MAHWRRWLGKPFIVQARSILSLIEGNTEAIRDRIIDRWYHCDFAGLIMPDALVSDHIAALQQVTVYEAVSGRDLRLVISEALRAKVDFSHFVDIGAGKGKACVYAAREFGFQSAIGVELSPPLVEIARANARKARVNQVQFVVADATSYDLPDGPTLVFLFNPFENAAMESFIAHNLHHFRAHKSLIAYVNDRHRRSITKFGFETLYRDQALKLSVYRMAEPQG